MKGQLFMKSLVLLSISAAMLCAQTAETPSASTKSPQTKSAAAKSGDPAPKHSPEKKPAVVVSSVPTRGTASATPNHAPRRNVHRPTTSPAAPAQTAQERKAAALPTVPEGAQEVGANLYRYTDPQGKTWMYRKTPFGVSKWEDKPEGPSGAGVASPAAAKVTDLGDTVQFERSTPFGTQKWTRKKSELTDEEKAVVEHAKQTGDDSKAADSSKTAEKQ